MRCGYIWRAQYLFPPPSTKIVSVEQKCTLERGHAGDHMSVAKVTASQARPRAER